MAEIRICLGHEIDFRPTGRDKPVYKMYARCSCGWTELGAPRQVVDSAVTHEATHERHPYLSLVGGDG